MLVNQASSYTREPKKEPPSRGSRHPKGALPPECRPEVCCGTRPTLSRSLLLRCLRPVHVTLLRICRRPAGEPDGGRSRCRDCRNCDTSYRFDESNCEPATEPSAALDQSAARQLSSASAGPHSRAARDGSSSGYPLRSAATRSSNTWPAPSFSSRPRQAQNRLTVVLEQRVLDPGPAAASAASERGRFADHPAVKNMLRTLLRAPVD
jgi:hypothetical protein